MAIAQKSCRFHALGAADTCAGAMGKKKKEELDKQFEGSRPACSSAGYPQAAPSRRCGRSCCRSPTTRSTSSTRRRTASSPTGPPTSRPTTRRIHGPRCLTSVKDDKDKSAIYLNECRRMRIQVLPPDVNESDDFTRSATTSGSALTAIRNVGANVVDGIVPATEKGRYEDFNDF